MSAREMRVNLVLDTTRFEAAMKAAAESVMRFSLHVREVALIMEVSSLTPDQVRGRFYVRGAMDSRFERPDQVDAYLRILNRLPGDRGEAARMSFLRGWAEHRSVQKVDPVVWHRYLGDTAIQVHPEAGR